MAELLTLSPADWLVVLHRELLLFACLFFVLGTLDEVAIDLVYFWGRLTGRQATKRVTRADWEGRSLNGPVAVLVPAWQEKDVIGTTITHLLNAWPQDQMRLYIGCYANDPESIREASKAAQGHPRARIVVHGVDGPTTKGDCLNRLWRAMQDDEAREGLQFRMAIIQDAEDMVDPAGLALFDDAIDHADLVQLPVLPMPQRRSRWVSGHYMDEFAESHGKAMVVRDWLGAGFPSAGVGCAIATRRLEAMSKAREGLGPFDDTSLTEDYELGLRIAEAGGTTRFLRARGDNGRLIATRACFPTRLSTSVRQKTRWVCGIALQGWDRMGWTGQPIDIWMRLRDRRGPFAALVLAVAYVLLPLTALIAVLTELGLAREAKLTPLLEALLIINVASLCWRALCRMVFATREYGWREGIRAILRMPVANIIAIMAGRRAVAQYIGSLRGIVLAWDKTVHDAHPVTSHRVLA